MAVNPYVALAANLGADLLAQFGGALSVTFTRPGGFGAYDRASSTFASGAELNVTANAFWGSLGTQPGAEGTTGDSAARISGQRALLVFGATLRGSVGIPADAIAPKVGDTVKIPGEPTSYALTKVTPLAAPSGGRAPLYRCEAAF